MKRGNLSWLYSGDNVKRHKSSVIYNNKYANGLNKAGRTFQVLYDFMKTKRIEK